MNIQFKDLKKGDVVFNRTLLPSQIDFWRAEEPYVLFSGGYGCGKSMILIMKTIYDAMSKDDNYILMGRRTYAEIHDVLLKDFFDICHPSWVKKYTRSPQPSVVLHTFNGRTSEIIFRNLDKFADEEIAGLNLGGFAIDQAEKIPEHVFVALKGRMRRFNDAYHKERGLEWDDETKMGEVKARGYMTANPALSWLFRVFAEERPSGHRLIEASTLENEKNLSSEYIEDLKTYPPLLYNQFVIGKWDGSLFAENAVFAPEHLKKLSKNLREPRQVKEGLEIYKKYHVGHRYQMGIDVAEGADTIDERYRNRQKDSAVITIVDMDEEEEVAKWAARLTPNATADKAVHFAAWYGNPMMVPEMNSMGAALVNRLQDLGYDNIYRRFEFDKMLNKRTKKLGFRTTAASKAIMIERFNKRLRLTDPKIYSRDTYAQMKSFVYTDVAGKKGAGAQTGSHDDKVMSLLLAFYEDKDPVGGYTKSKQRGTVSGIDLVPSLEISKDGKVLPPKFWRDEGVAKWTTL